MNDQIYLPDLGWNCRVVDVTVGRESRLEMNLYYDWKIWNILWAVKSVPNVSVTFNLPMKRPLDAGGGQMILLLHIVDRRRFSVAKKCWAIKSTENHDFNISPWNILMPRHWDHLKGAQPTKHQQFLSERKDIRGIQRPAEIPSSDLLFPKMSPNHLKSNKMGISPTYPNGGLIMRPIFGQKWQFLIALAIKELLRLNIEWWWMMLYSIFVRTPDLSDRIICSMCAAVEWVTCMASDDSQTLFQCLDSQSISCHGNGSTLVYNNKNIWPPPTLYRPFYIMCCSLIYKISIVVYF